MKVIDILSPISLLFALIPAGVAQGQLIPDNSLGAESSVVIPIEKTGDRIKGGAVRGSNIFHSFSEFNVEVGRSVYFANPPAIENILTRVTGGNPSNIFGTLGVEGNANLFLINPGGILFGADARLDISGSFFATTGDGIRLGENRLFSATDLDPSSLLDVRPEALFGNALANHMARLNNQGNLAVGTSSSLVLHGGEVTNSGSLTAPGGTVMLLGELLGLLDNARIDVSSSTEGGNVFIGGFLGGRGNIPTAAMTYIGPNVSISADADNTGDGGNVIVWAEDVTRFYGNITARGGLRGGNGGFVEVSGARRLIFRGNVDTTAAVGKAGTLLLDPRNIIIANGSPLLEIEDAQSLAADIFNSTSEEVTIYESQLEALSGETNIRLQAIDDIVIEDLADDSLSLTPGTGDIAFRADADRDGVGDFSMADPADTINTNGRDIAITGASLTLGNIDTSDTSIPLPDGAGEVLETAAIVSSEPGEPLESISGRLSSAADVDLYQIYLTGEGTFSATTIDGSNADTQLFLFDSNGLGVYGNDDNREACNCAQSTLPAGNPLTPTAPGIYYLGINVFGVNPVSGSGDIFAAATASNLLEPTGAGGGLPLVGWENVRGDDLGDYTITLTGVSAASATFAEVIGDTVVSNSGAITLTATKGNITAGNLNAASFSGAGGEIRLEAAADIVLDGSRVDASGVVGGGRDITLNSGGNISLNNSFLTSSTNGRGDAGKVTMTAPDTVRFSGGGASSEVNSDGVGDAGGIEIITDTLEVIDGAEIIARTLGEGDAGGIEIITDTLEVADGAFLAASTLGKGNAGTVRITATQSVLFTGENSQGFPSIAFSGVEYSGEGDAGGIEITTGTLSVTDGAQLNASTLGVGDAGTVRITTTGSVLFARESSQGFPSGAFSRVEYSGEGDAGGIEITTDTLYVTDGAQLSASTRGEGSADNVIIEASEAINISGLDPMGNSSGLFTGTESDAKGKSGDIILYTPILNISEFGAITTRTRNDFRGGNIEINTNRLSATGGAQIISSSSSSGQAGTIEIDATDKVTISDAEVSVSSVEGVAGSVNLTAYAITLNNGTLSGETADGDEGNINLTASDIRLFSESKIITDATDQATGGDINIDTNTLVLENSNITARAVRGQGGNIQIRAQGIFRDKVSSIDANSQLGVDGTVQIQTQIDPARGLVPLGSEPIDASSLISKGCEEYRGSEFIITGRGGIPPHPFEMLPGEVIWLDWRALTDENSSLGYSVPEETSPVSEVGTPEEGELPDDEIRQAQGWLQLPDGTVVLTAYRVKMTPVGPVMQHPGCQIILGDSEQ